MLNVCFDEIIYTRLFAIIRRFWFHELIVDIKGLYRRGLYVWMQNFSLTRVLGQQSRARDCQLTHGRSREVFAASIF